MGRLSRLFLALFFVSAIGHALDNNTLRRHDFEWRVAPTEHFDIYFDDASRPLLPRIAAYLEQARADVGRVYGHFPARRLPFFFFSDHNLFEQNNIVPIGEGTGGVTEAFKTRILIFHDGSSEWLRHVIPHEYVHAVQFDILFSTGFFKSYRLLKAPFYPLWMMEGMAEFGAGDVDVATTDMVLRDAVAHNRVPKLSELHHFAHLKPHQVTLGYKTGEMAIRFLSDRFGSDKPGLLLRQAQASFDVSTALKETIGMGLEEFDRQFQAWVNEKYRVFLASAANASDNATRLTPSDRLPAFHQAPVVSPDGVYLYYFSDRRGPSELYRMDLGTKKIKRLLKMAWTSFDHLESRGRALSISRDGKWLAFAGEKSQREYLYLFDIERRRLKKVRVPFDALGSAVFSPVADELVCVGVNQGATDLFRMDLQGRVLKRLTQDARGKREPVFSSDGTALFFSVETVSPDGLTPTGWDIHRMEMATGQESVFVSLEGRETEPAALPDGSLVFVRDRDDAGRFGFHLRRAFPDGRVESFPLVKGGLFSPYYSPSTQKLFFVSYEKGERHIYERLLEPEPTTRLSSPEANPAVRRAPLASPEVFNPGFPLSRMDKPYRFRVSTDIFLPLGFYSTDGGLLFADLWQVSDAVGNHRMTQFMSYASDEDEIDFSVAYTYARFRPTLTVGVERLVENRDIAGDIRRRVWKGQGLVSYPLDRVTSVGAGWRIKDQEDEFQSGGPVVDKQITHSSLVYLLRDTVTGRYLAATRGQRLGLFFEEAFESWGGNQSFRSGFFEGTHYWTLPKESAGATRIFYGRSVGREPDRFGLGGVTRIRGLSDNDDHSFFNAVYMNNDLRLRLSYLNARTPWLVPDIFVKGAYVILFDDIGQGWNTADARRSSDDVYHSTGVGLSFPTFLLQSFQLDLTLLWARETTRGNDIWYITLGPSF